MYSVRDESVGGAIEKATVDYFKQVAREGLESIRYFTESSWPRKMVCVSHDNIGVLDTNENFTTNDWMHTLKTTLSNNTRVKIQPIVGSGLPINLIKEDNTIELADAVFENDLADYMNYNILATFFYYRSLGTALGRFLAVYYNDDYKLIAQILNKTLQKMRDKNTALALNNDEIAKQQKIKIILILRGIEDFLAIKKNENTVIDGLKWAAGKSSIYDLREIIPNLKNTYNTIYEQIRKMINVELQDGLTLAIT